MEEPGVSRKYLVSVLRNIVGGPYHIGTCTDHSIRTKLHYKNKVTTKFITNRLMSLSSILQLIQRKGKLEQAPPPQNEVIEKKASPPKRYVSPRPVDPIVAKLKEKRRLEKEKKEQEARLQKGLAPKKPKSFTKPIERVPRNPVKKPRATPVPEPVVIKPPAKKMNFNELMKKASNIDQSKLSIAIQNKKKSPDPGRGERARVDRRSTEKSVVDRRAPDRRIDRRAADRRTPDRKTPERRTPPVSKEPIRQPLPTRKPSSKLEQRLKSKKQQELEDEEEDDWIVSDEEEQSHIQDAGYDRDEIWAMFNKGKKRSYYDRYNDYDSEDDMEATGAEILEEEMRSRRRAEMEDRKEMEEEKRLAELKRKRMK